MSIGSILYNILFGPLELFFEVVFVVADKHVSNPAYAIIILSLAMNFLVLPLYRRADAVQAEERDRENAIAPWVKHIKRTFKGDERFMMLQAYYREVGYKPTDTLKGSISLLLEIPFFIAAYHFLSHLQTIKGVSFGPITDLGVPDALLNIGPITLNALPLLMTLINVISAAIYMKGFPIKSKVQMYGIAAIFLVLLYNSPAGLVFYWTLNNLFSLIKNLFYKMKNPERILKILCSVAGIILLILVIFAHPMPSRRAQAIVIVGILCMQIPMIPKKKKFSIGKTINEKDAKTVFYASCALIMILTGILIPSSVISDSTEEFISTVNYFSPYWIIVSAGIVAFGTMFIWFGIFYRLASNKGRIYFSLLMVIVATTATIDYMFFGKRYGNFSSTLVYDVEPTINATSILINTAVIVVAAIIIYILFIKKLPVLKVLSLAMCLALAIMSGMNILSIQNNLDKASSIIETAKASEPIINLNKKGINVVVIMMDRQIGHYIPFIMHEKPELKDSFDGFTYYANSFSYGTFTNVGSPGLFGGYEYTPKEMNLRSDEKLADKHNEALKVMPRLFSEAGFDVTVFDPPYAGYTWTPDLSVFDDIPDIQTGITNGRYSLKELNYEAGDDSINNVRKRNFFLYSVFKTSPALFQKTIYAKGTYNSSTSEDNIAQQEIVSLTESNGMNKNFLSSYATLSHLQDMTKVKNDNDNTFLMMSNDLTHEPMLLQEPSFSPSMHVDNSAIGESYTKRRDADGNILEIENEYQLTHYQTNVAAMLKLGEWLDYLKDNDVYDNTRIIIVSDHGRDLRDNVVPQISYKGENQTEDAMDASFFNSVLLVKDFDATGFKTEGNLIPNAETPTIAVQGLIANPTNPYTGNELGTYKKQNSQPELIYTFDHRTDINNGTVFLPSNWFTVKNNIYDKNNWEYIGYH